MVLFIPLLRVLNLGAKRGSRGFIHIAAHVFILHCGIHQLLKGKGDKIIIIMMIIIIIIIQLIYTAHPSPC